MEDIQRMAGYPVDGKVALWQVHGQESDEDYGNRMSRLHNEEGETYAD